MRQPGAGFAVLVAVLLWALAPLAAKTVYVDPQRGDDARGGESRDLPVKTLARGLLLCGAGDVLDLTPGTAPYLESLNFGARGGLPGRPIVVEGHGAVLSGLRPLPAEQWQDRGAGLWFFPTKVRYGSLLPFLVRPDGTRVPAAAKADALAPGEAFWDANGVLLRCAAGQQPGELGLRGTMLAAGVALSGASHLTVRDLTCEYFANDGFNIHGSCQGLFFENIVARHNGDDGFSVHEDVGATVHGGWFHDNSFGIQDVTLSRSQYVGVRVENNRLHGVHFNGGAHSLTDSLVQNNGVDQLRVERDPSRHMGVAEDNPFTYGTAYVYNTVLLGGRTGILASQGSRVAVRCCYVAGAVTGVQALGDAVLHVNASVVTDCGQRELHCESSLSRFDGNVYWPGRTRWAAALFEPGQFAEYRAASGQDAASVVGEPLFADATSFRLRSPAVLRHENLSVPGVVTQPQVPFGQPVTNPLAKARNGAAEGFRFDFETVNPWSRVYPVPEKGPDGKPLAVTAELSSEQAVSGQRALKLEVVLPAAEARIWQIKLFSLRLESCTRPVRTVRFQLFGDGSGMRFCPRLRDAEGESFSGPEQSLDWQGWREVFWDLEATPPRHLDPATGNRRQDVPPLEVILDLFPATGPAGGRLRLYADDLEIALTNDPPPAAAK